MGKVSLARCMVCAMESCKSGKKTLASCGTRRCVVRCRAPRRGEPALHVTATKGSVKVIEGLLESGAQPLVEFEGKRASAVAEVEAIRVILGAV